MQDKTINNALLALRKQIIRGKLDGLSHVEALLRMRGIDAPRVLPPKAKNTARRWQMRLLILEALSDGPKTLMEVVGHVSDNRPEVEHRTAYLRTAQALYKMKLAGMVRRDGRIWRLAP